ncbi:MAG: M20/M25/M40 family metallo-hydrolase, partial [Bacilli bacterium]
PNASNVIPSIVNFTIDSRHINQDILLTFVEEVEEMIKQIAYEHGIEVVIDRWLNVLPQAMDQNLVNQLQTIITNNKLSYLKMVSGAGHDAQLMGRYIPTAMIFTPSLNGISHSPQEYTKEEDLLVAIKVLKELLYQLAY